MYSFMFQSPTTAYVMLFCLNFFSGLVLLVVDAIVVLEALDFDAVCYTITDVEGYWIYTRMLVDLEAEASKSTNIRVYIQ